MNYFEFYNLPISVKVDKTELKRLFYQKSKELHPDFYTLASEEEQNRALELSSLNNKAYKTLNNEDLLLKYLLDLKNVLAEEGQNHVPQDFLMDMMEVNEALMEIEMEEDTTRVGEVQSQVNQLQSQLDQSVAKIIDHYDDSKITEGELNSLKEYYLKKRYLLRIKENLDKFAAH